MAGFTSFQPFLRFWKETAPAAGAGASVKEFQPFLRFWVVVAGA